MTFKFVLLAACLAVANAGDILSSYPAAYSHYSTAPLVKSYAAPAVAYTQAAPVYKSYAAPAFAYNQAAPVYKSYAAPAVTYAHAAHAAPAVTVAKYAAAPAHSYAAPAYKVAAPVAYASPAYKVAAPLVQKTLIAEQYAPAHYDFAYSVQDPHTGDIKEQHETRQGDDVHGSYSLVEPDGTKRTVEYTADEHNGFNAVVHREPAAHPVAVKAVHAAPVVKTIAPAVTYAQAAPVYKSYAAPAVAYTQAAPVYKSYAAPAVAYTHHAPALTAAPALKVAAPAYSHAHAPTLSYAAPSHTYAHY